MTALLEQLLWGIVGLTLASLIWVGVLLTANAVSGAWRMVGERGRDAVAVLVLVVVLLGGTLVTGYAVMALLSWAGWHP